MSQNIESIMGSLSAKTSRRQALKGLGLSGLGLAALALSPKVLESAAEAANATGIPHLSLSRSDVIILTFALNLEFLEAEFYSYAVTGNSIETNGVNTTGGLYSVGDITIKDSSTIVPFTDSNVASLANEIYQDEMKHVLFLQAVISAAGYKVVSRPAVDLLNSFNAAAAAAGVSSEGFDPFAGDLEFLLGAFIFEDVGVTAYHGAAPLIGNKTVLASAAGILGVEAYHAAAVRQNLYRLGSDAQTATAQIAAARASLDGTNNDDQGVAIDGAANIVPTDANGLVFARTTRQVEDVVYLKTGATKGGFFPNGMNL